MTKPITSASAFLWKPLTSDEAASRAKSQKTVSSFAKALERCKTGKLDEDEIKGQEGETVSTVTQTMSDGSVMIMVLVGTKVVSEHKCGGSGSENPKDAVLVDTKTSIIGKIGKDGTFGGLTPASQTDGAAPDNVAQLAAATGLAGSMLSSIGK